MKKIICIVSSVVVCNFNGICEDISSIDEAIESSTNVSAKAPELSDGSDKAGSTIKLYYMDKTETVEKVLFKGLKMVEEGAIEECLHVKAKVPYSQAELDLTLKDLFAKGFFSDVKFIKNGATLEIHCVEKPLVDKVAFEGNDAASDEMLKSVLNSRIGEGKLISVHVIKDVLADMHAAYLSLGYSSVVITPKVISHPGNKVDVVFEIYEGLKTSVKKILLVGNKEFDDQTLKDIISTKEDKIWRFWDYESHVFREDRIAADVEAVSSYYKNNGFPEITVVSNNVEKSLDGISHYCTFILEEGKKYNVGVVTLESKIASIKKEEFATFMGVKKGDLYNESMIVVNRDVLRREVGLKNNPFTDVVYETVFNKDTLTVDIKYTIVEKERAFVERIDIVGNVRTLDSVIRREFVVHEGDPLNVYKIQRTVERLKGMDYFDDVEISEEQGSAADKKILVVRVKEKDSTAQIRFGLTISDSEGFGGMFAFTERNLMGTGRTLGAELYWMQKHYGTKVDLYDPCFLDKNFGVGVAVGAHNINRKNVDDSVIRSAFVSPYMVYKINDNLQHKISLAVAFHDKRWYDEKTGTMHNKVPDDIGVDRSVVLKDEFGKYTCGELSSVLSYAKTDNPYDPRSGYDISLVNSIAGLVGNVQYINNKISCNYYYPLSQKVTFIATAECGYIHEIKNTRSGNRYSLGGDGLSMRGFDTGGIGPRDQEDNSLGGTKFWTLSMVAKAPLSSREIGINGVVFFDMGSAWGSKYSKNNNDKVKHNNVDDSSAVRASVGVAIEWTKTPFGCPLSLVFGFPLKKKKFDKKQIFTLSGMM